MNSKEHISVPLPANITSEEELALFENLSSYTVTIPRIKKLKNVFVTHDGLVLKNGLLVDGCAFNLRGNEDNTFYYPFWRDTIEKYAVCKWGKSLKSLHLKGEQPYLLIHSKWFNYGFWINDFLPRLMSAEQAGILGNTTLIVPEEWQKLSYVWDSLQAFDVKMEIVPAGVHLFADNLWMPETRQWSSSFCPSYIKNAAEKLVAQAEKRAVDVLNLGERIYLTRSKRGVRGITNEDEIIAVLKKYNFSVVTFEDLTIWQQIRLMSRATHFVSIHGAGFSNIMFMNAGAKVLELINKPYAVTEYRFPFWKLANAVGLNYFAQFCDVENAGNALLAYGKGNNHNELNYLVNKSIAVDIRMLEKNINSMIHQ